MTYDAICDRISNQVRTQQVHDHMRTCEKGALGRTGCRMCFGQRKYDTTHPVMLVPLKEQATASTTSEADALSNDSDSSSIDIADSDTDEESASEQEETIYYGSDHAYSIRDPIPVDLKSYSYTCNNILDKNARKCKS